MTMEPIPDLPPSLVERRAALLEQASEKLREASQALSDISGLVRDVPYLDWNKKSNRLPIGFVKWHLDFIADALEKRAKE